MLYIYNIDLYICNSYYSLYIDMLYINNIDLYICNFYYSLYSYRFYSLLYCVYFLYCF